MRTLLVGLVSASLVVASGELLVGQSRSPRVTGIFTDMHYITDVGDLLGTEVFIVGGGNGYKAIVQIAQGSPGDPVVVPVTVKGNDVSFELPPTYHNLKFSGRVSTQALTGNLGSERVALRRRNSYWQ